MEEDVRGDDSEDSELTDLVESRAHRWMDETAIPGAAVAVTDADRVLYAAGFGTRGPDTDAEVTAETLFPVASCSKPITAAVIARLAGRGELQLTDSVNAYVPDLAAAPGEPITIEELLTHTSGMLADGSSTAGLAQAIRDDIDELVSLDGHADHRAHVESAAHLRVTDRDRFAYYNSGYAVLGRVIEAVTGDPFEDAVRAELFEPLGMTRSMYAADAVHAVADRAHPCVERDGTYEPVEFPFYEFVKPIGGLFSSVTDLAAVIRLLLRGGRSGEKRLLDDADVARMTTPQGTFAEFIDGHEVGYGYGLQIQSMLGDTLLGHSGGAPFGTSWFGYLEEAGIGIVVTAISAPSSPPAAIGKDILGDLQGESLGDSLSSRRFERAMARVTGAYEAHQAITTATVERLGGGLELQIDSPGHAETYPLVPTAQSDGTVTCAAVRPGGICKTAEFDLEGDEVTLLFDAMRLTKVQQ